MWVRSHQLPSLQGAAEALGLRGEIIKVIERQTT